MKEWNHYDNTQVLLVHCSRWNCVYIMVMCIVCDTSSISSSNICNSNTSLFNNAHFSPTHAWQHLCQGHGNKSF